MGPKKSVNFTRADEKKQRGVPRNENVETKQKDGKNDERDKSGPTSSTKVEAGRSKQKVGKYTILSDIGHGAFADVHRVQNDKGEEFALKMIRRHCSLYNESPGSQTQKDVSFLSEVDHKFIVKLVESFRDEDTERWCIITEICKEDLRKPIERKRKSKETFDEATILSWFGMMSSALDHLHDKQIMHRDIKPENVLVCEDDTLKLCDFGLAKFLTSAPIKYTQCGTPDYSAPEVSDGKPYDMKCDVWSLGVILFELCTVSSEINNVDKRIRQFQFPDSYSEELKDTVRLMLQENPAERPNIKTVCHIYNFHRKMESKYEQKCSHSNSKTGPSFKNDNSRTESDSGYGSTSQSTGGSVHSNALSFDSKKIPENASRTQSSFLCGLDTDRVSVIESTIKVWDIVHSPDSGIIYVRYGNTVSGYKWDGEKKTFTHLFSCEPTGDHICWSLVLAPLQHTTGTDQLYISVGFYKEKKHVYRVGGKEMKKKELLADTSYITDNCDWWVLGSDADKQILIIRPVETSVMYIHVKEQRHAKVQLDQTLFNSETWIWKIDLIGQNLLLGQWSGYKLYMFDLVVTEDGASIKSHSQWGPVHTSFGHFAAVLSPLSLSDDDDKQQKQLHLITAEVIESEKCTVLHEYRVGLFGSDVTSGHDSFSTQPTQSVRVERKRLHPGCVINAHTSCPVLIGRDWNSDHVFALELNEVHVQ